MVQTEHNSVPWDRTVERDLEITEKDNITVSAGDETFSGQVTRIDTYNDTVDVERVIQINISYKHKIGDPSWEKWKGYLVEEPVGFCRANLVLYNGEESKSRSRNLPLLDDIVVE